MGPTPFFCETDRRTVLLSCMRDVERATRDHGSAHAEESSGTPGRTTNVSEHGAARGGGAPYTTATMTGDRVPWSDRPEAAPRVDLSPKLSSAPAAALPGPGLIAVQKLYTTYASGDGGHPDLIAEVVKIVERQPEELSAIRAFIEARDGADAGHALFAAVEESKRKKNGMRFEGGALDVGNVQLPRLAIPVWAGGVTHKRDNAEEARIDDFKENEKRRAQAKGDRGHNPIVDGLNRLRTGPEKKSEEQLRNEDKLTVALEDERKRKAQRDGGTPDGGSPDAGSPLEIRKRLDD